MTKTPLQPSPTRTYVVQVYTEDYSKISFRKFILPEGIENTCDKATTYFYQQDLFSCGESAYPIEMHSDIREMQPGFIIQMNKKEFALAQIAPYYHNSELCGYDGTQCSYLTEDGKMCVAGKNMIHPENYEKSLLYLFLSNTQQDLFKPEVVGILTNDEWILLQRIHDEIATNKGHIVSTRVNELGLFTIDELKNYKVIT